MKKFFLILLSSLSLTAFAQQKIALLEPRVGEGSTMVSGMEKAMVRGELRKAIVNFVGYEVITRSDIDQMMKEQNFQRTGMVSETQIKKMGEMSGADYICVSTLNKSNYEFYLEAYLIHVESGSISNPASQYGELVDGKLVNMLPTCQALAEELLSNSASNSIQNQRYKGNLALEDGIYIGEILNSKPDGEGKLQYKESDEKKREYYLGNWKNGEENGHGVLYYADGEKYDGNWKAGLRCGYGTYYFADGTIFEGQWEDDIPNGHGIYQYAKGYSLTKYIGNIKDGERSGKGVLYFANGNRYEGDFDNDTYNGYGTYYFADGRKFEGIWKDGEINGYATYYYASGLKESGYYVNGEENGEFTRIYPDGSVKKAIYSNGEITQQWH